MSSPETDTFLFPRVKEAMIPRMGLTVGESVTTVDDCTEAEDEGLVLSLSEALFE